MKSALLILFLLMAVAPFVREILRPRMGRRARTSAPGNFVKLSQGTTHFDWLGPKEGPIAVCVHGLTTPSFVWQGLARALAGMGFRVLVYDLYGRGWSDRPGGRQNGEFFSRQLEELLADQGVVGEVTLIGYSMGGSIATVFAATHPGMLRRLILIAPAGMGHHLGRLARIASDLPVLGDWMFHVAYPRLMRKAIDQERHHPSSVERIYDRQAAELKWRGFVPAVLSSLRGILSDRLSAEHKAIAAAKVPVLAIWARKDTVIPITGLARLAQWNRHARQAEVADAEHAVTYTHTDQVAGIIGSFVAET